MRSSPNLLTQISNAWYKISSPPLPPPDAPLLTKEVVRRARVISLVMLVSILLLLFVFAIVPSSQFVIIISAVFCTDVIAVLFNRRGKILVAGIIISIVNELGLLATLLTQLTLNHGVDIQTAIFIPLLAQSVIIVVSTLPAAFAVFNLFLNSAIVIATLTFVPYAPSLQTYLHNGPITVTFLYYGPLVLIVQVTILSMIWVNSTNRAIRQVDRADAQIQYEQMIALQAERLHVKLEQDVSEIAKLLAGVGNDPTKEIRINQQNALWTLASSLNVLRRRLVAAYREIRYLKQLKNPDTVGFLQIGKSFTIDFSLMIEEDRQLYQQAALQYLMALDDRKEQMWNATGTPFDEIVYRTGAVRLYQKPR